MLRALLIWLLIGCSAWAASSDELGDLAARLQFHFYAADVRALQADVQQVAALTVASEEVRLRDYQLAYGQWKLAELLRVSQRTAARRATDECLTAAGRGLALVPKRGALPRPDALQAELYIIQAACYWLLAELSGNGVSSRAAKALDEARLLQPNNPRLLLVAALSARARAHSAVERAAAVRHLAEAVAAFDAQGPGHAAPVDWGHAEALVRLGELQLHAGEHLAARNSLERALVLAPDYAEARALLMRAFGMRR